MTDKKINLLTHIINETATRDDFLAVSPFPKGIWDFLSAPDVRRVLNSFGLNPFFAGDNDGLTINEVVPGQIIGNTRYRLYYRDFGGKIDVITYKGQHTI